MNAPEIFSNERTIASAGTGKTYTLTNRFIALMRRCEPENICALTFTRMSAGEFLDAILEKLARASSDADFAESLAKSLSQLCGERVETSEFKTLLKRAVDKLPKLTLSTIDSFEVRFAQAFSAELGMSGDLEIMDDFELERRRKFALKKVLENFSRNKNLFESFSTAVNAANGGKLEKQIFKSVRKFVDSAQKTYRNFPDLSRWGDSALLAEPIARKWDAEAYESLLARLLSFDDKSNSYVKTIKTFFSKSRLGDVYSSSSKGVKWLKEYACDKFSGRRSDNSSNEFYFGDASAFTPPQLEVIDGLLELLVGGSVAMACNTAAAIGSITAAYLNTYKATVRARGKVSFDDLPEMLSDPSREFERRMVEYRLDSKYDHWLLDEFQDTSRAQWKVLSNLVEEILSDTSGERTMYYVGDRKQSIYGWRDGDPKLFDEIFYDHAGMIRDGAVLDTSRRSSSPIIEAVNTIFNPANLVEFGESAAEEWKSMWTEHKSHPSCGSDGCAVYVRESDSDKKIADIYAILKEINPAARGLSCAILVAKNSYAAEIIEGLRALKNADSAKFELSVAGEIDCEIAEDNMPVPALLALVKAAAHSGDSAAEAYVKMTPLAPFAQSENWRREILAEIYRDGFGKFFARCFAVLKDSGFCKDEFSKRRILNLLDAAGEYDSQFEPDADEFLEFISKYKIRESSRQSCVQVMTVHKSKGLGFDFVIMPQIDNTRGAVSSIRLNAMGAKDDGEVIVNLPSQVVCDFSDSLSKAYGDWRHKTTVENICKYYVAVTRAKRGIYFIGKPLDTKKADSGAYSFEKHLARLSMRGGEVSADNPDFVLFANLECAPISGDLQWFEKLPQKAARAEQLPSLGTIASAHLEPFPPVKKTPSQKSAHTEFAKFSAAEKPSGKSFGTLVHALFEQIGGVNPRADLAAAVARMNKSQIFDEAVKCVEKCLDSAEIYSALTVAADVSTEFAFSALKDSEMLDGVFDRIAVVRSEDGIPIRVEVLDFKTDSAYRNASDLAEIYAQQMKLYRCAAAALYPRAEVSVRVVAVNSATISESVL